MASKQQNMIELAERMKRAYGDHYVAAGQPRVLRNIISRYEETDEDDSIDEALMSFMRTRGPYLQALDLPREGPQWSEFAEDVGLHDDVVRTFTEAGFERLYEFQAQTIRQVLADDHTLVTAGTGRGKTESWLIPILQYITEAKAEEHPTHPKQSVKCVLTYPTKALAQDQLKRLIEYLYELNRNRTDDDQITVGIYDGDTPPNDPDEYDYLSTAYQFFECPCDYCDASLTVERTEDERFRVTHDATTTEDVSLDFIHLTRDEIIDEQVDILLTNPDTINYRLFNVNEADEQSVFISQPKYLVFDEIHEYSGLFGAFTAALMRRYIRARQELLDYSTPEEDDLRLIGSSATVENRRTIFNRINPFTDPPTSVVTENPETITATGPVSVEEAFYTDEIGEETLSHAITGDASPSDAEALLLDTVSTEIDGRSDSARELLENALYTQLLSEKNDQLGFVRALYAALHEKPMEIDELVDTIESMFDLDREQAEILQANFVTIGRLSGVLESRAHLFSWPIDGYYTCLNCATVYDTPRAECTECSHHFVTKLSYCNHCGEEALESWFCPSCERLSPLNVTSPEGRFEYFHTPECTCETEMIRTVWRPFYECSGCGERQKIDRVHHCPDCDDGTPLILAPDGDELQCTDPECTVSIDADSSISCHSCDSEDLSPLSDDDVLFCIDCGEAHAEAEAQHCSCGGDLTPKRFLGWQCSDTSCSAVFFGEAPRVCDCGNRRFVRTALFDVNRIEHCESCDRDLFPGQECFCDEPNTRTAVRGFTHYKQVDERGQIRTPTDFPGAVPCYDRRKSYGKSNRYESMLRGPGNTAVTTSQYHLRSVVDRENPESFQRAKLLSFSDSQSDMKELTRDFNEPEEALFFTQLVVSELDDSWTSLETVQENVWDEAQRYEKELKTEIDTDSSAFLNDLTTYDESTKEYIYDEAAARILSGRFNNRWSTRLQLPNDGIVNVRFNADLNSLSTEKREIIASLHTQAKRYVSSLSEEIEGVGHHIDELVDDGLLVKVNTDNGYLVGFNPEHVECALVSESTPISYDPVEERFYTEFDQAVSEIDANLSVFTADYESRSDIRHPHFSLTAFRIASSDPVMLLGQSYFGNTERKDRRRIEYQFREGRYPHFLSSGPAMELGVDIGDLDSLLLYGTPPNANSYLQRVGRAGRKSGSSLIHSVSRRNPIDYYYFERPSELIRSDAQPVPLNEANEEVLARALTWAVFDFIAATRWVPWRRETSALQDAFVYDTDEGPIERSKSRPNDIVTFGSLLANSSIQLQPGSDVSPLEGIRDVVTEYEDEARSWIQDLLRFSYCRQCGRKHNVGYEGPCADDSCSGSTVSALEEHSHVVDSALENIESQFVDAYVRFEDDLYDELDQIEDRISDLRRASRGRRRNRRGSESEGTDGREELERLRERRAQLDEFLQRLEEQPFGDFLSSYSNGAFSLRTVSDTVTYELIGNDFEYVTQDALNREVRMALSELHPGAAYLHSDNQTYVVTEVIEDSYETPKIREELPDEAICLTCGTVADIGAGNCDSCGRELKRLTTIVPKRVRAYKSNLPLETLPNGDQLTPSRIYRNHSEEVQSTYAPVETEVVEFKPDSDNAFEIVDGNGGRLGTFAHGAVELRSATNQFKASYKGGGSDPLPTVFELCGNSGCNGVISRGSETAYCTRHPEHDVSESRAVRLATEFGTKGVRIQLDSEELEHTVAHGLRVALQYIGGVGVRQVPETIEDDGTYVYDGDKGGSGITVLLTEGAEEPDGKFQQALELIEEAFECDCDDGCPFCVFQYGCTEHNDPHSFDKEAFQSLLDEGLELVEVSTDEFVDGASETEADD